MKNNSPLSILSLAGVAFLAGRATSTAPTQESAPEEAAFPMAKPGKFHRLLDPLEGTFHADCTFWTDQGEMKTTGTATNEWVLGGHYLRQSFEGEVEGVAFQGLGFTAYDDRTGTYQTVWMDVFSNHIAFEEGGRISEDGRTITIPGRETHPELGELAFEDVTVIESPDRHTFTRFYLDEKGERSPGMRMVYTRE